MVVVVMPDDEGASVERAHRNGGGSSAGMYGRRGGRSRWQGVGGGGAEDQGSVGAGRGRGDWGPIGRLRGGRATRDGEVPRRLLDGLRGLTDESGPSNSVVGILYTVFDSLLFLDAINFFYDNKDNISFVPSPIVNRSSHCRASRNHQSLIVISHLRLGD